MSILSRQTRHPIPFEGDRGADGLAAVPGLDVGLHPLIVGTAGSSPYLAGLIRSEAAWLPEALDAPEATVATILKTLPSVAVSDLPQALRQAKRRIALITALADLSGAWPLEWVTQTLTDFADCAVDVAIKGLTAQEITRGKLPGMTLDDAQTGAGMVALAMGKMGAGELNYSSDIDLICLFDGDRFDADTYYDARASLIKVTRRMAAMLSDVAAGGYVFRTDLRLRPDPSATPVCLSMDAAERYYESVGRTWERAAYIKARPAAGDLDAGKRFLKTLTPFVWRKHLDFAAIEDAHDMRLKIRDHKGLGGPLDLNGHHMKLGSGGIREIEFFTQTRQLIAGGRDMSLRVRGTHDGLARLADAGWIGAGDCAKLQDHYRNHREVEHRLQMINDAQTHSLPSTDEGFARLAALMGTDVATLQADLTARLTEVHALTEGFFAPDTAPVPQATWGEEITNRWPQYPALRSDRASAIFERLRPAIMDKLQEAAKPQEALLQFDSFLAGLPAGVQLFSLFEANPQLTQLIVDIAATAPALAQHLSRNAGVFDAVLGGDFFGDWPGLDALKVEARAVTQRADDYEAQLSAMRRWAKEWHFRIGVHHLRGLIDAQTSGTQYADLAEAVLHGLWPAVTADFARKHGDMPGRGAVVLGMGSLGARRLNAVSDLDLIVIYDPGDLDMSTGPRPLAVRPYFARLTQALVTALSAPMADGRLYEVDMRLRPSGKQGPVATSLKSFSDYQTDEAWTWEHLALTRARPVAGAATLGTDVITFLQTLLPAKGKQPNVLPDLADMRDRIIASQNAISIWDAKIGPGRLQDCELFAQALTLVAGAQAQTPAAQLHACVAAGVIDVADAQVIDAALRLFDQIQATARLLSGGPLDPSAIGEGGQQMLLREAGTQTMEGLQQLMQSTAKDAAQVIGRILKETANGAT